MDTWPVYHYYNIIIDHLILSQMISIKTLVRLVEWIST